MVKLRFGVIKCLVCGSLTLVYVKGKHLRETCICKKCKSANRQRQIAYVACQAVGFAKKERISSMKDFTKLDDFVVYNTEARGAIHCQLSRMKNYICSEYFGNSYKSGDIVGNITHQDLMDLSLSDECIDLVISSDVFEHIPEPYKAHQEVYRVLKRGTFLQFLSIRQSFLMKREQSSIAPEIPFSLKSLFIMKIPLDQKAHWSIRYFLLKCLSNYEKLGLGQTYIVYIAHCMGF